MNKAILMTVGVSVITAAAVLGTTKYLLKRQSEEGTDEYIEIEEESL